MHKNSGFQSTLVSLWFRSVGLGIVALVFSEALVLVSGKAQGWTYFLPLWEVAFEVWVRLVFVDLGGIVLGTLYTALVAPFLWYFRSKGERIVDWATKLAVVVVLFLVSRYALTTLIVWSYQVSDHRKLI